MVCYMTHRNGGSKVAAAWALLKRFRQSPVISLDEHRLDFQRAAPTRSLGDLIHCETLCIRSRVVKTGDVVLPIRVCSHSAIGRGADEVSSGCVSS
jgi:hypothetical protein